MERGAVCYLAQFILLLEMPCYQGIISTWCYFLPSSFDMPARSYEIKP